MLSGRGVCDELITRPEESYQLWCVVVCDLETSRIGAAYMYDISSLRVNDLNMLLLLTLPLISGYDPQFCLLFPLYNTLDMARWVTLWFTVTYALRPRKELSIVCIIQLVTTSMQYEYYGGPSCGWSFIRAVTDAKCSSVCNYFWEVVVTFRNSKLYLLSVFMDCVDF